MSAWQLFDEVGETVRSLVPDLGELHVKSHSYGVKVWIGTPKANREHYEAQVIGPRGIEGAEVLAVEVGFHTEHPDPAENLRVMTQLGQHEKLWRKQLGDEPVLGEFLGGPEHWCRLSETWPDPNLSDPEIAFELAARLVDYLGAIEPVRRDGV